MCQSTLGAEEGYSGRFIQAEEDAYCLDDDNDCSWVDGDHIDCEDNEFGCHDGSACISIENKCNGVADCVDGSDECHSGCDNLCDQYGGEHDDGDDGSLQCVLDSCPDIPDPAVQGGGAFCDWLNSSLSIIGISSISHSPYKIYI